jgi:hypothetical protein
MTDETPIPSKRRLFAIARMKVAATMLADSAIGDEALELFADYFCSMADTARTFAVHASGTAEPDND